MKELTKSIIEKAFNDAFNKAGNFDYSQRKINSMKSAAFVEQIGILFQEKYKNHVVLCQKVKENGEGKISGEWMLDIVVCNKIDITEKGVTKPKPFYHSVEWAVESEYNNSLEQTLKDFSKLLVVKSKNLLYLNGYASLHKRSFENNIKKRLTTIKNILKEQKDIGQLYYCFWPSPEQKNGKSFWKNDLNELLKVIKLYKYDSSKNEFIEIDN